MTARRRIHTTLLALALISMVASCGDGPAPLPPRALPTDLVPSTLPDPTDAANPFRLVEFEPARARFARAGSRSLVDDGALWEIRRGANLVGTIEVGMLDPRIQMTSEEDRRKLIVAVLPASSTTIRVRGISVVRSSTVDKISSLILGNGLFELVEVKITDKVDPEQFITALIEVQLPTGHLKIIGASRRRPL